MFVEGQRLWPSAVWLNGARLSLSITNLTNSRQAVTDSGGDTPLLYQAAYRDPTGRLVQFEFRKTF
jgi:outer membrane receptor protein involved in Fe transport